MWGLCLGSWAHPESCLNLRPGWSLCAHVVELAGFALLPDSADTAQVLPVPTTPESLLD